MRRLRLKLLFVVVIVLGLMITTALPAKAVTSSVKIEGPFTLQMGNKASGGIFRLGDVVRQQVATYTVAT
jgi:hypothetical protein